MDLVLTLPEGFACNRESLLAKDDLQALHDCVLLILRPVAERGEGEHRFLTELVAGFRASSHFAKDFQPQVRAGRFEESLETLRRGLKNDEERLTAYKILFLAAVHSERPQTTLVAMTTKARAALAIDPFAALLVSDGIAAALPSYHYAPRSLSEAEREAAAALACLVLAADHRKDAQETLCFRLLLTSVGIAALAPQRLAELIAKGPAHLVQWLPAPKANVALLHALRIAVADRDIKLAEQEIVREIARAAAVDKTLVARFYRHIALEIGIGV